MTTDQLNQLKGLSMGANSFRAPPGASGRFQGAEAAYRDALQLATDFPNVPDYENELALTLSNLGWLANA